MEKKRPTWVSVVGVLTIIFGILGIFGAGQQMIMPFVFDLERGLIGEAIDQARFDRDVPVSLLESIEEMMNYPDWFKTWSVISGLIGMLIAGFYLFSGIWLFLLKPSADKMLISAFLLSILYQIVAGAVIALGLQGFAFIMLIGMVIGMVIDFVLLLALLLNDRSIFRKNGEGALAAYPA